MCCVHSSDYMPTHSFKLKLDFHSIETSQPWFKGFALSKQRKQKSIVVVDVCAWLVRNFTTSYYQMDWHKINLLTYVEILISPDNILLFVSKNKKRYQLTTISGNNNSLSPSLDRNSMKTTKIKERENNKKCRKKLNTFCLFLRNDRF